MTWNEDGVVVPCEECGAESEIIGLDDCCYCMACYDRTKDSIMYWLLAGQ